MTIKGMPFDAKKNADGTYDRVVYSQDIADYFGYLSSNGILLKKDQVLTDQLKVTYDGITTTVNTGVAMVEGRRAEVTEAETLRHEYGGTLPRYDLIVLELNLLTTERCFKLKIIKGKESSSPSVPSASVLTRTSTIYQLGLAYVRVNAGSTSIASVTDLRKNSSMCGISYVNVPDEAKILSIVSPQVIFDSEKYGSSIILEKDSSNDYARNSFYVSFTLDKGDFPIWGAKRCFLTISGLSSEDQIFCTPEFDEPEDSQFISLLGTSAHCFYRAKYMYKQYAHLEARLNNDETVKIILNIQILKFDWSTGEAISNLKVTVPNLNKVELKKIEVYYY